MFPYDLNKGRRPLILTFLTGTRDMNKGTFTYYVIMCDLKNLVPFGHKEL